MAVGTSLPAAVCAASFIFQHQTPHPLRVVGGASGHETIRTSIRNRLVSEVRRPRQMHREKVWVDVETAFSDGLVVSFTDECGEEYRGALLRQTNA